MNGLYDIVREYQQPTARTPNLNALTEKIHHCYGACVLAIFLYGSGRQNPNAEENLLDLCVVVSDYRLAHHSHFDRLINRLLPPNVYFTASDGLRSKYIVVSKAQLASKVISRWDHYFWARYSQPFTVLYADNSQTRSWLIDLQVKALSTFYQNIRPLQANSRDPATLWSQGLRRTYACELRPEPPSHADALIEKNIAYWTEVTKALEESQICGAKAPRKLSSRWRWRRVTGKLLNLLRLIKAASTVSDGLDYIAWKVERHSGVPVVLTPWMKRHPRLAGFRLAWQLKRDGGIR